MPPGSPKCEPARSLSSCGRCDGLHDVFHDVFADLQPHLCPDAGRETVMETGPDAGTCNLFRERRHAVPTVRNAGRRRTGQRDFGDVGGSEHDLDNARYGATLDAMCARIFRVHRRRGDRLPGWLAIGRWVAIEVAVTNSGDRPPETIMVLGIQHSDDRVAEPNRHQRHQSCTVEDAHLFRGHELAYKGVVRHRRADEPEAGGFGLLRCSLRTVLSTIVLELVVIRCPLLTV